MSKGTAYLMYHELARPGRALCYPDDGYRRYVIPEDSFAYQLDALKSAGFTGISVGQHLQDDGLPQRNVVITFDDGCETDLLVAAPLLKQRGFSATFYVVSGWIGRAGFLSAEQLRELHGMGFEIGSHSRSHAYLSDLSADDMHREVDGSKHEIEQVLGHPVHHFSCPGGRWNDYAVQEARSAGYESFALSHVGLNPAGGDHFALSRLAVKSGTSAAQVTAWAEGTGLLMVSAGANMLGVFKKVMGNGAYEKMRSVLLRREH